MKLRESYEIVLKPIELQGENSKLRGEKSTNAYNSKDSLPTIESSSDSSKASSLTLASYISQERLLSNQESEHLRMNMVSNANDVGYMTRAVRAIDPTYKDNNIYNDDFVRANHANLRQIYEKTLEEGKINKKKKNASLKYTMFHWVDPTMVEDGDEISSKITNNSNLYAYSRKNGSLDMYNHDRDHHQNYRNNESSSNCNSLTEDINSQENSSRDFPVKDQSSGSNQSCKLFCGPSLASISCLAIDSNNIKDDEIIYRNRQQMGGIESSYHMKTKDHDTSRSNVRITPSRLRNERQVCNVMTPAACHALDPTYMEEEEMIQARMRSQLQQEKDQQKRYSQQQNWINDYTSFVIDSKKTLDANQPASSDEKKNWPRQHLVDRISLISETKPPSALPANHMQQRDYQQITEETNQVMIDEGKRWNGHVGLVNTYSYELRRCR